MMESRTDNTPGGHSPGKSFWASGWILVSGLIFLCALGTWLTAHHYNQRVFSSNRGVVVEAQSSRGPESRISIELTPDQGSQIKTGHPAKITAGNDANLFTGEVLTVTPGDRAATVIIRLTGETGAPREASGTTTVAGSAIPHLEAGTRCDVTIDTTIPPEVPDSTNATVQ